MKDMDKISENIDKFFINIINYILCASSIFMRIIVWLIFICVPIAGMVMLILIVLGILR